MEGYPDAETSLPSLGRRACYLSSARGMWRIATRREFHTYRDACPYCHSNGHTRYGYIGACNNDIYLR